LQDRHAAQSGAIVADDGLWLAAHGNDPVQLPGNARAMYSPLDN
jgi:hypothetical protein